MQNLVRRGNTWFARFFVPKDRWADAGKATRAASGIKRDITRTLGTTDRKEARKRLGAALTAIQADLDAALKAAGLRPLTDWTADWSSRAIERRAELQAADATTILTGSVVQDPADGQEAFIGETERDLLQDQLRTDAEHLEEVRGSAVAEAFFKAATTEELTLHDALEAWLAEAARRSEPKTIEGHRKVFSDLEEFVREKLKHQSLASMTFADVSRRMAGEFIAHRAGKVSAAAVKREFSAPMGLWRWARRSYATALEAGMNAGGRVNPAIIASLMGQQRGTLALDLYSKGAALDVLRNAVADLETTGLAPDVLKALAETMSERPRMVRFAPVGGEAGSAQVAA